MMIYIPTSNFVIETNYKLIRACLPFEQIFREYSFET